MLSRDLAAYGSAVFSLWIGRSIVFSRCRERNIRISSPPRRRLQPDEVEELAAETVAMGLTMFQRVIAAGGWEPARGASLKTFFTGQCLLQFSEVYGRWCRVQDRHARLAEVIEHRPADFRPADPGLDVRRELEEAELSKSVSADPATQAIVWLKLKGYEHAEIAELLGLTEGAVESRLYRLRRKGVPWATGGT